MTEQVQRDPVVQALLDKQEINEVLVRYLRAIDRADGDLLKSCYHPDAKEEHGGTFEGTAADYCEQTIPLLTKTGTMTHLLTNVLIELKGDIAYSEAYCTTFLRVVKKNGESFDSFTCARLLDRFEKRNNTWKIAHRKMTFEWNRDVPSSETWVFGSFQEDGIVRGQKNREDLSYQWKD